VYIKAYLNVGCCTLFMLWQFQLLLVFGALRPEEEKGISESLWQYTLLKAVFLGVILDPSVYEIAKWVMVRRSRPVRPHAR